MPNDELLDLYSDYLISAFGQTTATGLAAVLNGQISHDRVQRWLASPARTSQDVWRVVKPHVRAAAEEIGTRYSVNTVGGVGYRPGKSDHPTGYALDFMCNSPQGDGIAEYAYRNAARLKVKYIIWKQRIRHPNGGWRQMGDRGGATANHMDHVHISFNP